MLGASRDGATNQGAYTGWSEAPDTHIAEQRLVLPQWEEICLILQRFEAPGKEDAGVGEGEVEGEGEHPLRGKVEEGWDEGLWEGVWERGDNGWNVNK